MGQKRIVSIDLRTEMRVAIARRLTDYLDKNQQQALGLDVVNIPSMKLIQNTAAWKKWRGNWVRRRKQINQYFDTNIRHPEDFINAQTRILTPERLCFYLAAYTCIEIDCRKEALADAMLRKKELKGCTRRNDEEK